MINQPKPANESAAVDTQTSGAASAVKLSPYKRTGKLLAAVVGVQLALLACVAVPAAYTLHTGQVVTLKTAPVDPYDMFRGDYVRLGYDISNVNIDKQAPEGSTVYAALQPSGEFWTVRTASTTKPALLAGEVCIKGRLENQWGNRIHYGIEQVYVPEKTGYKAERADHLKVDVAVDEAGNAVIKRVTNGKEIIYDAAATILGAN